MSYQISQMWQLLHTVAKKIIGSKDLLTHIDNLTGDGDLGISMEKCAYSILGELEKREDDDIEGLLRRCAVSVNRDAPSTMGTLVSLAIMEASKLMKGKSAFKDLDLLRIPERMVSIIMIRGRAQLGDKTVLDALIPYSQAIVEHFEVSGDICAAALEAARVADKAANATKGTLAKIGRAKWIGERSRDCPDGGAVVCAIVVNAMVDRPVLFDVPGFRMEGE